MRITSKPPVMRYAVEHRDGKLFASGRELILPHHVRMIDGQPRGWWKRKSEAYRTDKVPVGGLDGPQQFYLNRCSHCEAWFLCNRYACHRCPACMGKRHDNAARAARRQEDRAGIVCAVCGENCSERRRGTGDRPAYCSSACRQRAYRHRASLEPKSNDGATVAERPWNSVE